MTTQTSKAEEELKGSIKGSVLVPDHPGYEEARQIWNAMIDRRPAVIVQCAQADDVPPVIRFARENRLELSIRGAGHNIAGNALCDNGVTIDFSRMKNVRVDAGKRRAYVEPGATLANLDEAAQAHGLATPVGINSTTGIAGLTLGGGFGWLTRKYGMTIDNLVSVDMITADGKKIRASENDNADLFWAIRGGGGNFGVVTQFEFQLFPVGPEIRRRLDRFSVQPGKADTYQVSSICKFGARGAQCLGRAAQGSSIAFSSGKRSRQGSRRAADLLLPAPSRKQRNSSLLCALSAMLTASISVLSPMSNGKRLLTRC